MSSGQLSAVIACIENFVVQSSYTRANGTPSSWNDAQGVSMVSPCLSVKIIEPSFLANIIDGGNDEVSLGRFLEADIHPSKNIAATAAEDSDGGNDCRLFGILLYELFSGIYPFPPNSRDAIEGNGSSPQVDASYEPAKKKSTVRYDKRKGKSYSTLQTKPYTPLQELGFPSSVCMLVQDLMDCHGAYSSLNPFLPWCAFGALFAFECKYHPVNTHRRPFRVIYIDLIPLDKGS